MYLDASDLIEWTTLKSTYHAPGRELSPGDHLTVVDLDILNAAGTTHLASQHPCRSAIGNNRGVGQLQIPDGTLQFIEQAGYEAVNGVVLAVIMAGKNQWRIPVQQGSVEVFGLDVMGIGGEVVTQSDAVQRGNVAFLNGLPA